MTAPALITIRWILGLAFLPHIAAKLFRSEGPMELFTSAGLPHPRRVLILAVLIESAIAASLLVGIYPRAGAALGAVFLAIATLCVLKVSRGRWIWLGGGAEYPAVWAALCAALAWFG